MARRRKRSSRSERVIVQDTSDQLLRSLHLRPLSPMVMRPVLREVEDRREFHPARRLRPARMVSGLPAPHKQKSKSFQAMQPSFAVPKGVAICVRRKERREVLFARRKTRKGSGGGRRFNEWSKVKC